jgi:hypothetical protein
MKTFGEIQWSGKHWCKSGDKTQYRIEHEAGTVRLCFQQSNEIEDWLYNLLCVIPCPCKDGMATLGSSLVWWQARDQILHDLEATFAIMRPYRLEVHGYSHGKFVAERGWPDILRLARRYDVKQAAHVWGGPKAWIFCKEDFSAWTHTAHYGDIAAAYPCWPFKHQGLQVRIGDPDDMLSPLYHEPWVYREAGV